jgi:hypothetical protein
VTLPTCRQDDGQRAGGAIHPGAPIGEVVLPIGDEIQARKEWAG